MFLGDSGFFIQIHYTRLTASADLSADLILKSTNSVLLSKFVNGDITATQNLYGVQIGWETAITSNGFLTFAVGLSYPDNATVKAELSPDTVFFLSLGGLDDELDEAVEDLEEEIVTEINDFRDKIKIYPTLYVSVGFIF